MRSNRMGPRRLLLLAVLVACPLSERATRSQEKGPDLFSHVLLAPGIAASAPYVVSLRAIRARLVLRNFAIGHGQARAVPNDDFSIMELNSGHVFTTIAGDRKERVPGDFWSVQKGQAISLENPQDQAAAIIRVTYFTSTR